MRNGADPVLSGFMKKYGGQRANDHGPICPLCGKVIVAVGPAGQRDRVVRLEPERGALFGPNAHAACADSVQARIERGDL